jgi:hypothetical protein
MLWFDNDVKSILFPGSNGRAITKYGKAPNICFVHPSMTSRIKAIGEDNPSLKAGEIEVRTTRSVLPNHIWIGVNGVNGHVNA